MNWLSNIVRELISLFVDDGSFALQIILWLAVMWAAARFLHHPAAEAITLFLGLAVLLILTLLRFARRSAK